MQWFKSTRSLLEVQPKMVRRRAYKVREKRGLGGLKAHELDHEDHHVRDARTEGCQGSQTTMKSVVAEGDRGLGKGRNC